MDDETRRDLNERIGRSLFDWTPYPGDDTPPPYCTDGVYVAPLAKALRAKGWHVAVRSCWLSDQWAAQLLHGGREITEYANTMPLALALAAACAVGEEQTNDKI